MTRLLSTLLLAAIFTVCCVSVNTASIKDNTRDAADTAHTDHHIRQVNFFCLPFDILRTLLDCSDVNPLPILCLIINVTAALIGC